jgi:hypothetical protein
MKALRCLPVLIGLFLWIANIGACATVAQTDAALVALEASLKSATSQLEQGTIPTRPLPLDVAVSRLGPIHVVVLGDGRPVPFDSKYIIRCLSITGGATTSATQSIDFYQSELQMTEEMRAQLRALSAGSPNNAAQIKKIAIAELSKNDYQYEPPPLPSTADRFGDWLSKQIGIFFSKLFPKNMPASNVNLPPNFLTVMGHVLMGIVIVVGVGIVTYLVVILIRWIMDRKNGGRIIAADDAAETALLEARDVDTILVRANQLADAGEYRKAFRLIYLASLVALDTDGILHFDRSRTNWEYLRELRRAGRRDLYDMLVPFTREFDRIWYGFGVADASAYAGAVIRYKDLKSSSMISSAASGTQAARPTTVR